MDFIDMIVDSSDEFLTGYFYKKRPKYPHEGRITFSYKQYNANSKIFDTILGDLRADKATYAISTNDDCDFNVGGYIVTQNGLIWEIVEVVKNEETKANKDVLRWFTKAIDTETNVRMIEVDDLFDQVDTYEKYCNIRIDFNFDVSSILIKESLRGIGIEYDKITAVEGSSILFKSPKNTALTIEFTKSGGAKKTMQIPSYKTLENEIVFEYNA